MNCPRCESDMLVDTLHGTDNNKIVIQGFICDECDHSWKALRPLSDEDWHGKYD